MRVSQNELYRVAQRALEATGAAYGIDRDGAFAVAWLEARGLPGIALLAAALEQMDGALGSLAAPREEEGTRVIDLAGRPAIAWAGALVDCFDVPAGETPELHVRGCRWPLCLLPLAARRGTRGRGMRLRWGLGEGFITCVADSSGACRIVGAGLAGDLDGALRDGTAADVVLAESTSTVRAADRDGGAQVLDSRALDAALEQSLAEGIAVDAAAWAQVGEVAKRVLVPPSEQSRIRGAGGGDANV